MSYDFFSPTGIANEALMHASSSYVLGDLQEGSEAANICLRLYGTARQQILRTAGWDFARKQAPLTLVADASGQTDNVGTEVPGAQFIYAYAWPTDCMFFRYIPWNPQFQTPVPAGNIVPADSSSPLTTASNAQVVAPQRVVPARFLVTGDINNLEDGASNLQPGSSPISRTVVLTNVQEAEGIYTFDATYPNLWPSHFREAVVAYLAALIAMPIHKGDSKAGMAMRAQNIAIAQDRIKKARVTDGKESWSSSDLSVDWMRFRSSGGYGWNAWGPNVGMGDWNCTYADIGAGNASAY